MLLQFTRRKSLFLLLIYLALGSGSNVESESYPTVKLQPQEVNQKNENPKFWETASEVEETDGKKNHEEGKPAKRLLEFLIWRNLPENNGNNSSVENRLNIKEDNHSRLFEVPSNDEVKNPLFKTEGGLRNVERLSISNGTHRSMAQESIKFIDDGFDDQYDLSGKIDSNGNNKESKDVDKKKFNVSEKDEGLDKSWKPKFRFLDTEDHDLQNVMTAKTEKNSLKANGTKSSEHKESSEKTNQKNGTLSTIPLKFGHQDNKTAGKNVSTGNKKATKHRKAGKKRKGKKKNSRKSSMNLKEIKKSGDERFTETKRPGHAVIYSEKAKSQLVAKNARRYSGIDRKPTLIKSQTKKIKHPEMEHLYYDTIIRSRYARTTITGSIKNYGKARDINVNVILPSKALITAFETNVNGKSTTAVVRGKNSTLDLPNVSVAGENVGTMLVEARDCDASAVSINVPKDGTLNYTVTYEYLLERNLGIYAAPITIHNNMWIKHLMARWRIQEERNITTLQTPSIYKTTALPLEDSDDNLVCVTNEEPGIAEVIWEPTISEQKKICQDLGQLSNKGVVGVLELRYDVQHDQDPCGQVVQQDGYFAQFFAAPNQPPLTKHVVFILDVSDSMMGEPIKQLKTAMLYILDTLQPMDNFTLINFSDEVKIMNIYDRKRDTVYRSVGEGPDGRGKKSGKTPWPGKLETYEATPSNIKAAKEAIKIMKLRVFTNIYDALIMGFKSVKDISALPPAQTGQPHPEPIIIFLTDGHASDGPSYNHDVILKMVEDQNHNTKATMFALGFGGEADMGLLRRFALATNGIEKHIYKDIDAADQLVTFFQSIKAPVLKDVYFKYNLKQVMTATLTEQSFPMIYRDKEVIIAGKLDPTYPEKGSLYFDVTALGRSDMIRCEGKTQKATDKKTLIKFLNSTAMNHKVGNSPDRGMSDGIVERIWAFLKLNQLRDGIELDHFDRHQQTDCDDALKPIDRMLEICLRFNYSMPVVTNLVYDGKVMERISISPESGDPVVEIAQTDPLSAFPWILKLRDEHGFAKLPITNKKKGRMYTYLSLGVSENPPPPRSCDNTVDGAPGECRYLPECPDPNVLGTPQKFRRHFCRLGSSAGVCCSDSMRRPSRSKRYVYNAQIP